MGSRRKFIIEFRYTGRLEKEEKNYGRKKYFFLFFFFFPLASFYAPFLLFFVQTLKKKQSDETKTPWEGTLATFRGGRSALFPAILLFGLLFLKNSTGFFKKTDAAKTA